MGSLVCSECGREQHYHAGRGSQITDVLSDCCQAHAAKGRLIAVAENNLSDAWSSRSRKVYLIGTRLQFAGYSGKVTLSKDDGEFVWFVAAKPSTFRPEWVRPDWVGYYKIAKTDLARIGWKANEQQETPC